MSRPAGNKADSHPGCARESLRRLAAGTSHLWASGFPSAAWELSATSDLYLPWTLKDGASWSLRFMTSAEPHHRDPRWGGLGEDRTPQREGELLWPSHARNSLILVALSLSGFAKSLIASQALFGKGERPWTTERVTLTTFEAS